MRLSNEDVLRIWESAQSEDPIRRALAILAVASPGTSREELGRLPLGRRDARLMALREETFGPAAEAVASCPTCAEAVEFTLDLSDLRRDSTAPDEGRLDVDGWSLTFRLPSSEDVSAAVSCGGPEEARRVLAHRCLLEARWQDSIVEEPDLPPAALARMAAAMAEQDPQAELVLDYSCPACGTRGETVFDIAAFLWDEIHAEARRLLAEVHALARAYGWREADILAMSATRRRAYLDRAT